MAQSKEPTIEQMNEAIGVFMGYKMYDKRYPRNHGIGAPEVEPERCLIIQKTKYHTSWDWLMPVVKKIKGMHFDILQRTLIMEYMHAAAPMNSALISIDLEKLHAGVYNFLLWYNQQPQTNGQTNGENKG